VVGRRRRPGNPAAPGLIPSQKTFSRRATVTRWRALRVGRLESRHAVGRVTLDESYLETLSHLASDPRQTDEGDALLLHPLARARVPDDVP